MKGPYTDCFQENRILSHDLLEGCYIRSGLLSDVFLYEENPSSYESDLRRHHRWIRGDWQIAGWILPWFTNGKGQLVRTGLSALSRWKIFDNLRRSLLPLSLLSLLILGWFVLPSPWLWTLAVSAILLLQPILAVCWQLLHKPTDLTLEAHLSETAENLKSTIIRFVFRLSILPYEAFQYTDAILRTLWRMIVTRRQLLEWTSSATVAATGAGRLASSFRTMAPSPLLALTCTILLWQDPRVLWTAGPFLILWMVSPAVVWYLGRTGKEAGPGFSGEQISFLHKVARKTWSFFEQFVTAGDNWLPPDNFQEHDGEVIAHRTSPTNIGLALLSGLGAYDFGYISGSGLVNRCILMFGSMEKLERFKGHFYNWYDTQTLAALHPKYVSTVDSGNLAGHLLTLRQGLLDLPGQAVFHSRVLQGFVTTAGIILDHAAADASGIDHQLHALLKKASSEEDTSDTLSLAEMRKKLAALLDLADRLRIRGKGNNTALARWIDRLFLQLNDHHDHLLRLIPWMDLLPVPERFAGLADADRVPTPRSIPAMQERWQTVISGYREEVLTAEEKDWLDRMSDALVQGETQNTAWISQLEHIAEQCLRFSEIAYDFLLEPATGLLRIGYNVDEQRKDNSFYDLLASEVRLGIFTGIAQDRLPQASWFALGRLLTNPGGHPILLSWSGSMFEYLMPLLVMPSYEKTLLSETSKAAVKRQIVYGEQRGTPWGISESAYYALDTNLNYQYRAFGVPGLGLNRGLEENLVIAPYATMLALMVLPEKACSNLQLLAANGLEGEFGFYESVDYTPSRLPRGKHSVIVRSYMIHHQGMGLLSLTNVLLNKPMQQRFAADPGFQATLLLLQEKVPRASLFYAHTADKIEPQTSGAGAQVRIFNTPHTSIPEIQLLSNGSYHVMITNSGAGYSRWHDLSITRWREDPTKDDRGIFCYIRDVNSGNFWSNTYEPTLRIPQKYEAIFSQGHAEFRRRDYYIDTHTEIVISQEDDAEMRRVRLTNHSSSVRVLEVTSYTEVVIAGQAADEAHPAFSNLFVQTEILPDLKAVICTRRPRSEEETPPWMFHLINVHGTPVETLTYETARLPFIGRGRTLNHPLAMDTEGLSGSEGTVLDPIAAIRCRLTIRPGQTATIDLIYGIGQTRETCEALMHKYRDEHLKNRAFELSWTHNQVLLRQINATEADALLYDQMAANLVYPNQAFRGEMAVIAGNSRGQSALWSHSVSGDLPIVLLHMSDEENIDLAWKMILAHTYWRLKGLFVDLVIWNEDHGSYRQLLQDRIEGLVNTDAGNPSYHKPGKIFVRSADQVSPDDRILFESVARVVLYDHRGSLSQQLNRINTERALPPLLETKTRVPEEPAGALALPDSVLFYNGMGGFAADGKEYKIYTDGKKTTPAPWVNVIANPLMGTVVSDSGSAYTWAINAQQYRLTPWSNDPVCDAGGEAFYLRDEETGLFWCPAAFPVSRVRRLSYNARFRL